jgi:citrate lyase subunit beta/citryl-CoA lyase
MDGASRVTDWDLQLLRAVLFVPGNSVRKLQKAKVSGADAIAMDLEDAVPADQKSLARETVRLELDSSPRETLVSVRVNAVETGLLSDDIGAIARPGLDCVIVPKVQDPEALVEVDRLLTEAERAHDLDLGSIRMLATIETARGIVRVHDIVRRAPARLLTLLFGAADLALDLDIDLTPDATELLYARSRVAIAAKGEGLRAPIDGAYLLDLRDIEGLLSDTRRSRQLGFQGRAVIHPSHVMPVQEAYSLLTDTELSHALRLIEAFEEALSTGVGAIAFDGRMVDYPIYYRAKNRLMLHEHAGQL